MPLAFAFGAPTQPDFSGVWRVNLDKSTFHGQPPRELLVKIEHVDPALIQTMRIVAADGREQRQTFIYETTGRESTNKMGDNEVLTRARWNGAELIIDSVMKTPTRTYHFSDHWSLSADRRVLQMAHRDDDLAGQVAILEKASDIPGTWGQPSARAD
jgi:hypothetical protein